MFEDLPNEVILEIFSFLELTELRRAFSPLNYRLECLLYDQWAPLHARFTSQMTFDIEKFFARIKYLSITNWLPNDVLLLLQQSNLSQLNNLTIVSTDNLYFGRTTNDIIHQILSLTNLHKCQINLSPTIYVLSVNLPISSSIHHLTLSMITLDMLFHLLIHLPQLCSLNVWLNSNGRRFDSQAYDQHYYCLRLKKMIIGLHSDIKFEELLFLLHRMPILRVLEVSGSLWDHEFLNSNHWKNILLGEHLFPLLNQIKVDITIRHTRRVPPTDLISSQFNEEIFHRTNFSVTFDRMFWFHMRCLWIN